MVLKILGAILPSSSSSYYLHVVVAILVVVVVHAFAQGRATTRERDMHGRVVLVTGAFTPLGLTLIQNLAERGAHVIALSSKPIDHPEVDILIELVRSTTRNDHIYADECDVASSASVRAFCTRFIAGKDTRLDAIVFAHEYAPIGSLFGRNNPADLAQQRRASSLATFLMTTLLLPVLLVAPVERDIRIVNVVNPFYAAAAATFAVAIVPAPTTPLFKLEGRRSLETVIFMRHLQRVLDALPSGGQVPKTDEATIHVVSDRMQKSNIVAVSVCPGISRTDTVATLLNANTANGRSVIGTVIYIVAQPLLRWLVKSQKATVQSILHVLFLPTPFKSAQASQAAMNEGEVLKAGALYRECAVVGLPMPTSDGLPPAKDGPMPDDGELGGVHLGQSVWESFEIALKEWEKTVPAGDDAPSVDTS